MGKKKVKGEEAFDQYYQEVYGDRWAALKEALSEDKEHIALANAYFSGEFHELRPFEGLDHHFHIDEEIKGRADKHQIMDYYFLDAGSAFSVKALELEGHENVLDLCAAPGGKTLEIFLQLNQGGTLKSNDRSRDRRERLKKVIQSYIPQNELERIQVTGHDASTWSLHEQAAYDKILLDAPCSSERHVLHSAKHMDQWGIKRTKKLAINQGAMILSALDVLKPGGRLVYSTCSISPLENDDVIAKAIKKKGEQFNLFYPQWGHGEKTEFGTIFLPDKDKWGPLYIAVLDKLPN